MSKSLFQHIRSVLPLLQGFPPYYYIFTAVGIYYNSSFNYLGTKKWSQMVGRTREPIEFSV